MTATDSNQPMSAACETHGQPGRWTCGVCGKPVCAACEPVAMHYHVFHPHCAAEARSQRDRAEADRRDVDAPSPGVKWIAWAFLGGGIVLLGVALVLLGFAFFSRVIPIRALLTGPVPGIDDIPGGRTLLYWLSGLSLTGGALGGLIGMGLLNCARAARRAVLVLAWFEIVVAVLGWLAVAIIGGGTWDIPLAGAGLLWFFTRPSVRRQFEQVL